MSEFLQFLVTGVAIGAAVGLVGVGFILIYRVSGVINLAQGTFVVLGGLASAALVNALHLSPLPALVGAALAVLPLALGVGAAAIAAQRIGGGFVSLLVTIGLSILFEGIALMIFGADPLSFRSPAGDHALRWFGAAVLPQQVLVVMVAALLLGLSQWFLVHTIWGKALRACAANSDAARLFGISARGMGLAAFVVAGLLGAVVGFLVTPSTPMEFGADVGWTLNGFSAAILGGLDDPLRAMGGGLALGLAESFLGGYLSPSYETAGALAVMLVVLLFRPQGLFNWRGSAS